LLAEVMYIVQSNTRVFKTTYNGVLN